MPHTIYVALDEQLHMPAYYWFIWKCVKRENRPRREWLDELANTFRDFEGEFLWPSGKPYELPDLDQTFGEDPSMRWLAWFLEENEGGPAHKTRLYDRLRIFDLYFKIKYLSE